MTNKDIIDAWAEIRRTNQSIPDEVLDFMKDSALAGIESNLLATPLREQEKFHAVEYSGYWSIQTSPYYGGKDILNAEKVGEVRAEAYANLIVKLLNEHHGKKH
jgi:hypothetical protein